MTYDEIKDALGGIEAILTGAGHEGARADMKIFAEAGPIVFAIYNGPGCYAVCQGENPGEALARAADWARSRPNTKGQAATDALVAAAEAVDNAAEALVAAEAAGADDFAIAQAIRTAVERVPASVLENYTRLLREDGK